jgi:hypothetical protein
MGRSPAIHRGYDENRLRLEVRGDTMRMFVNGEELGQARDDEVALRGGRVELIWDMSGPPEDGDVEVRFTNFKVSSLVR